ncbi:MAG: type II toxin-antitoxin system prevent-host-death family antitoxin [Clostridia bacterium]|nr:type II toxin-antitoxin system prevent-host-death family antitoxin [Clostridia bacterium]
MTTATATDVQNNFGKYLQLVQTGEEIIILKNGKEAARLISHNKSASFLTDSLVGVLENDYDEKSVRDERMAKYEGVD